MEEQVWNTSQDPQAMLAFLRSHDGISQRKLLSFVAAMSCRGRTSCPDDESVKRLKLEAMATGDLWQCVFGLAGHFPNGCEALRDIFGPLPFRSITPQASWLTWNSGAIPKAAAAAYEGRQMPSGYLDNRRLAVLGDMLEEAGCRDDEMLGHLRMVDGVHVRGCWCVDLLLKRS